MFPDLLQKTLLYERNRGTAVADVFATLHVVRRVLNHLYSFIHLFIHLDLATILQRYTEIKIGKLFKLMNMTSVGI